MRALLLAVSLLFGTNVMALQIVVQGAPSCGRWVQDHNAAERRWEALADEAWLVGYLSGLSVGRQQDFWGETKSQGPIDNPSVFLWVTNYCNAHPLDYGDDAAKQLYKERVLQQKSK